MKQLLEFIPLILFFAVYKLVGIREAAITLVVATIIQLIVLKLKYGKIEKQQIIMGSAVVFFGFLTAYFNELEFLKWKVTIVYAVFALILFISQYGFKKPLIKQLLGKEIELPEHLLKLYVPLQFLKAQCLLFWLVDAVQSSHHWHQSVAWPLNSQA